MHVLDVRIMRQNVAELCCKPTEVFSREEPGLLPTPISNELIPAAQSRVDMILLDTVGKPASVSWLLPFGPTTHILLRAQQLQITERNRWTHRQWTIHQ